MRLVGRSHVNFDALAADSPHSSLRFSDSSLNLLMCPVCPSVGLLAWWLPGLDPFPSVQLSSARRSVRQFESTHTNSPRPTLARAGTLGPHFCPGPPGAVAAS